MPGRSRSSLVLLLASALLLVGCEAPPPRFERPQREPPSYPAEALLPNGGVPERFTRRRDGSASQITRAIIRELGIEPTQPASPRTRPTRPGGGR
jgi:hypothetical protein